MRFLGVLILLTTLACGGDSGDGASTEGATTEGATTEGAATEGATTGVTPTMELSFITWNVGLAHGYVPLGAARQPHIMDALGTLNADVICIQELFTDEDGAAARAALEANGYKVHIHVPVIETEFKAACKEQQLDDLKACLEEKCLETLGTDGMTSCAVDECPLQVAALSADCIGCLTADLTLPLDDIVANCIKESEVIPYAFEGRNGLLLATQRDMADIQGVDLKASLTFRSYITASIDVDGVGPIQLLCTHLSADLSVPYKGEFSGFPEEQANQIGTLLGDMSGHALAVLMGDMNTGPDVEGISVAAELDENYQLFVDGGWNSFLSNKCTWCPNENTLVGPGGKDHIIDHVIANVSSATTGVSNRILDQKVTVKDLGGKDVESNLSDHFGVEVKLSFPTE